MSDGPALRLDPLPGFLRTPALTAIMDALPSARVVGGAVRDALAGQPVADVDLATPLPPDAVQAALRAAGIKVVPTGLAHGTVTAVRDGQGFEITTLRRDVETDGRHAVVTFTEDWRADAARRDFTINAMSMTRDGAVFDYFGGIADLRAGRLRFVGDPAARMAEDWLRVLRYFRFYARYATEPPDAGLRAALQASVPHLGQLSVERVWNELVRILAARDPRSSLHLMDDLGVLAAVLTEGADLAALDRLVAAGAPVDPVLRFAALLGGDPLAAATRLKLANADRDRIVAAHGAPVPRPEMDDDTLRRLLADTPAGTLLDRSWLAGGGGADWHRLRRRIEAMPRPVFPLAGRDALAIGVPRGPRVGTLLQAVRDWWMAGGCCADRDACRAELRRLAEV